MSLHTSTLRQLAKDATTYFTTKQRPDGDTFVAIRDASPDWVGGLVQDAHGPMLADDWRYASIASALEWLADADDPDDAGHEWADDNVDVYTGNRIAWLASHRSRPGYCDEAICELGDYVPTSIIEHIGLGQYQEGCEVFASVLQSLRDHADSLGWKVKHPLYRRHGAWRVRHREEDRSRRRRALWRSWRLLKREGREALAPHGRTPPDALALPATLVSRRSGSRRTGKPWPRP